MSSRRLHCAVQVNANSKTAVWTAARAAVLFAAFFWLDASAEPVDFPLLPAVKSDGAAEGLLLDIDRAGERLLVAGERGFILWSDDNGQSWTQADVPVSLAVTSVTFVSDSQAWATAHDGYLLHSTDGGTTWEIKLTGSDVAALSVDGIRSKIEQLEEELADATPEAREDLEWALDDTFIALEDAELALDEGMTTPLLDVWFDGRLGYALGAYNVFLRSDDGGDTWHYQSNRLDNPDNYHLYAIARSSAGTLLVAGEAGTLLRSLDDGATWERIATPYPGSFFGAVAAGDGSLLTFGLRGNVFRSTDEGASWTAVQTGDSRTLMGGTATADGTIILAGAAGALLQSRNSGASFSIVPTEGNRVYSGVLAEPDGRILLVGFGGISTVVTETTDE